MDLRSFAVPTLSLAPLMALPQPIPLRDSEQVCLALRPRPLLLRLARVSASPLDEVFRSVWEVQPLALEVPRRHRVVLVSPLLVSLVARRRDSLDVEVRREVPLALLRLRDSLHKVLLRVLSNLLRVSNLQDRDEDSLRRDSDGDLTVGRKNNMATFEPSAVS